MSMQIQVRLRFALATSWMLFAGLSILGLASSGASASIPPQSIEAGSAAPGKATATQVTDDTVLYQNLSEIRVPRTKSFNVDLELRRVVAAENRYKERLPRLADRDDLQGPMRRVKRMPYRPLAPRQQAGQAPSGERESQ